MRGIDAGEEVVDDGRHESGNQRMDRNWVELLQELRVTQTGTQILSGFMLTLPFQPRFATLDTFQRGVYACLILLAACTIVLGLAPVNLHRALFRRQLKPSVVSFGHVALRAQLVGVSLIVVGTVLLVIDVAVSRTAGLIAGTGILALIVVGAPCVLAPPLTIVAVSVNEADVGVPGGHELVDSIIRGTAAPDVFAAAVPLPVAECSSDVLWQRDDPLARYMRPDIPWT